MATPKTLQQAILFFANYDNCHRAVMEIRWPDGVVKCPHCGSENVTYLESVRRWKCYSKHPKAQFSLKVGTIFEDSDLERELRFGVLAVALPPAKDRKSTRLNSSHSQISYAVFCLKKKKKNM